jgi:hypothetical protein
MNSQQIINEQLLTETKTFISNALNAATKPGYFMQGVDTETLTNIYNQLCKDNVAELSKQARDIVGLHLLKITGGIVVVGICLMGVGKLLNYCGYDSNSKIMIFGGCCTVMGFIGAVSIGH